MERTIRLGRILLAIDFLGSVVSAGNLEIAGAAYDKESQSILRAHSSRMKQLEEKYLDSLNALLARFKSRGDLDNTTALLDEILRFKQEKKIMPDHPPPCFC